MDEDTDEELLEADTEDEELSFYEEEHMEEHSYCKEDLGDELDDIFTNLNWKDGGDSRTDDRGETYSWETEKQIYTELKGRLHLDHHNAIRHLRLGFGKGGEKGKNHRKAKVEDGKRIQEYNLPSNQSRKDEAYE